MKSKRFPTLCNQLDCTGCAACANICPENAITMVQMYDGFMQPKIDRGKCVQCLACEKTCPTLNTLYRENKTDPNVYACWNKDKPARAESSSGGAFSALATAVLAQGGYVVGAAYDDDMQVQHRMINSFAELPMLRGSKYVQSSIGDIYRQVKKRLVEGPIVLFVGTPCQVAGLKNYLRKEYPNLYCCDFICHGTPSPLLFRKYIEWVEQKKDVKIHSFNFRQKRSGWYDAQRVANGNLFMKGKYDAYFQGFNRNITLRESCYHCPAIGLPRKGDVTIADFWGIGMVYKFEKTNEIANGISLMMANNSKGERLIEKSKSYLYWQKGTLDEALSRNQPMIKPSCRPFARDTFYGDLEVMDFEQVRQKYFRLSAKARLVTWFRENAPRTCVVGLRNVIQYLTWKRNGSKAL